MKVDGRISGARNMRIVQAKRAGLKTLTMLGIVLLLTGCAGVNLNPLEWFNSDEEVNPPKELVDISAEMSTSSFGGLTSSSELNHSRGLRFTPAHPVRSNTMPSIVSVFSPALFA